MFQKVSFWSQSPSIVFLTLSGRRYFFLLLVRFSLSVGIARLTFVVFSFHCHNINKLILNDCFSIFNISYKVHIKMLGVMLVISVVDSRMYSRTKWFSTKQNKAGTVGIGSINEWISRIIRFRASSTNWTPKRFL